jgi:hypothetical protein
MKLFNGWRLSVSYNGDPTRDMYAKRLTIYLLKEKEYIKTEEEEKEVWVPVMKSTITSTGYKL